MIDRARTGTHLLSQITEQPVARLYSVSKEGGVKKEIWRKILTPLFQLTIKEEVKNP